jgi:hypothetical protein
MAVIFGEMGYVRQNGREYGEKEVSSTPMSLWSRYGVLGGVGMVISGSKGTIEGWLSWSAIM